MNAIGGRKYSHGLSCVSMALLYNLNREGMTIAMVTHNPEYVRQTHKSVNMADGRVAHIREQHSGTGTM